MFIERGFKCASFFLYNIENYGNHQLAKYKLLLLLYNRLFLEHDPNCKKLVNLVKGNERSLPITSSILSHNVDLFKLLLDNGSKLILNQKDIDDINQLYIYILFYLYLIVP